MGRKHTNTCVEPHYYSIVANPARGEWNGKIIFSPSPSTTSEFGGLSQDRFGRSVPLQPAHFPQLGRIWCLLQVSSRCPRRRPSIMPSTAIGSVPSLSSHTSAHRWRSLQDGTAEPVLRDQIPRRIGNLTRLIHTLLYVTTIHTAEKPPAQGQ